LPRKYAYIRRHSVPLKVRTANGLSRVLILFKHISRFITEDFKLAFEDAELGMGAGRIIGGSDMTPVRTGAATVIKTCDGTVIWPNTVHS
jgi:hypothetical protein